MISLVIPIYNEEVLVEQLFHRTTQALSRITENFEVICVDDGSQDSSLEKLMAYHRAEPRFKVLVLSRNFGHQAAYTAGLTYAKGDYVVMMDGDLQDPPELIAEMYHKLVAESYDIIHGRRVERQERFGKQILIRLFHYAFKSFSRLEEAANVGNFSLMNRKALDAFLSMREKNRYLPGLRFFIGFKQGFVNYSRPDRLAGHAKMSFRKLASLAVSAIFSFSNLPVKLCLYTGLLGMVIFFAAGVYTIIDKILGTALPGWSSIVLSIYFLGSVQLVFMGIIGEYLFMVYREVQNRPIFIVKDFAG